MKITKTLTLLFAALILFALVPGTASAVTWDWTETGGDDEVHRDQHDFPEDVEQEEVQADEHPDHAGLQQEHAGVELFHLLPDRRPRGQDRDEAQDRGEQNQQHRDAVHSNQVFDLVLAPANPACLGDEAVAEGVRLDENWKYLPNGVDVIVFPQTEFRDTVGYSHVGFLERDGSKWRRYSSRWFGSRYSRGCRVAVLAR